MKTHLAHRTQKDTTACGRNILLGVNRSKSIFIVDVKHFIDTFKRNKEDCCENCVKEYNLIVLGLQNKEQKCN